MAEYIEREAFIRRLNALAADVVFRGCEETMIHGKDSCNPGEWTRGFQEGILLAVNKIESQGAADVAPVVHGRWIHKGQRVHLGVNWWACSVCGDESGAQWMRYCPNCGARMDL